LPWLARPASWGVFSLGSDFLAAIKAVNRDRVAEMDRQGVTDYFAELGCGEAISTVAAFLRGAGRSDTLAHCQAVASRARALAERFGVDVEGAVLAGSCHDLAAVVPHRQAVSVAEGLGLAPDPIERAVPILLHGAIGAAVLRCRLGVTDAEVLDAVRYHTTSRPGAGPLERVVFVADKIALDPSSPVRDFVPAVEGAAERSLEEAALVYLEWVVTCGPRLGWTVHPRVQAAWAELSSRG
jgi:predicted HD superfamily hydrolase involved in NAD metabolism